MNFNGDDVKNLLIGVTAGSSVMFILLMLKILRIAGAQGLIYIRRSIACLELRMVQSMTYDLHSLLLIFVATTYIMIVYDVLCIAAGCGVWIIASTMEYPNKRSVLHLIQGSFIGVVGGGVLVNIRIANLVVKSARNRAAVIDELRARAFPERPSPTALPTEDLP
jgi:hypothetical protein